MPMVNTGLESGPVFCWAFHTKSGSWFLSSVSSDARASWSTMRTLPRWKLGGFCLVGLFRCGLLRHVRKMVQLTTGHESVPAKWFSLPQLLHLRPTAGQEVCLPWYWLHALHFSWEETSRCCILCLRWPPTRLTLLDAFSISLACESANSYTLPHSSSLAKFHPGSLSPLRRSFWEVHPDMTWDFTSESRSWKLQVAAKERNFPTYLSKDSLASWLVWRNLYFWYSIFCCGVK